jgi:hypothetical protein
LTERKLIGNVHISRSRLAARKFDAAMMHDRNTLALSLLTVVVVGVVIVRLVAFAP